MKLKKSLKLWFLSLKWGTSPNDVSLAEDAAKAGGGQGQNGNAVSAIDKIYGKILRSSGAPPDKAWRDIKQATDMPDDHLPRKSVENIKSGRLSFATHIYDEISFVLYFFFFFLYNAAVWRGFGKS